MDKHGFMNRVRSLANIDRDQLPELTPEDFYWFVNDPVRYFMRATETHAAAIWREVEKRQRP